MTKTIPVYMLCTGLVFMALAFVCGTLLGMAQDALIPMALIIAVTASAISMVTLQIESAKAYAAAVRSGSVKVDRGIGEIPTIAVISADCKNKWLVKLHFELRAPHVEVRDQKSTGV